MILWFIFGCTAESELAQEKLSHPEEDGAYLISEEEVVPDVDFESLETHLEAMLHQARAFSSEPFVDAYVQLLEEADSNCPQWYVNAVGDSYWSDNCTTAQGAHFEGYGSPVQSMTDFEDEGGNIWETTTAWGAGSIQGADGRRIVLNGGGVNASDGVNADGHPIYFRSMGQGAAVSGHEEDWHAVSPAFQTFAMRLGEGRLIHMSGSYPTDLGHLLIDGLNMFDLWGACLEEPYGSISFYLPDVGWLDMRMAGTNADEIEAETPDCDGCLDVTHKGVLLGQVCLDFSVILDWDETPWE